MPSVPHQAGASPGEQGKDRQVNEVARVAIVTGGGTGIGAATALELGRQGVAVALVGRRRDELERTAATIGEAGGRAMAVPADMVDLGAPRAIVDAVVAAWGRIDVIINNAATIKTGPFEDVTPELFDTHVAVNVRGPYFLVQAALPWLKASDAPAVVYVSSSSGSLFIPGQSIYGMTKAAIEYHTGSLAAELAPFGIRVNCVAPGPVDTPIHLSWAGDDVAGAYERMSAELPLARMGTAEELGYWVAALAGPRAGWITGNVWHVDGGQVLPGAKSKISAD
jgi:NAD(P)-dependent dehydrogenase (short-subunit alcohol dehydrogenase family)